MRYLISRSGLWILLSALLFAAALIFIQFYLAWVALVPLFYLLQERKGKQAFAAGALFGLATGVLLFYWMPSVVAHFTGGSSLLGIAVYIAALIFAGLYFGFLSLAYAALHRPRSSVWMSALLAAALWTVWEWPLSALFRGMPWFGFHAGNMLSGQLYAIQVAEYGGVLLMSFCVVFVNALIAGFIAGKQWKGLAVPAGFIVLYLLLGYGTYSRFEQKAATGKPLTAAILCENTGPDVKWDQKNGDLMARNLLALNARLAALKPDIAVWTESAVPWTYSPDDPFVKAVIQATGPYGITHIMGINTDYQNDVVYNSAYCLQPDGKVAGRYDKRFLLSLVEKPLGLYALPFLSTDGFYARAGDKALPLPTFKGKAGVLICNEATVDEAAIDLVHNGADFLVNISNDGWFSDIPYLVNQHFYNARLRAVEVRKDMVVNSNMGISGKVAASGAVTILPASIGGYVSKVSLNGNNFITLYSEYKAWIVLLAWICVVFFLFNRIVHQRSDNP